MALLRVDPGLVLWLWITFGIILVILRFTVWGRITGALDKRSERIASDLEAARRAGEKAGTVEAEYAQKLREGREAAARIIEEARAEAARLRESMLEQSQAEAREIKERAANEIALAREDAERALRGQVISLSFSIADSILHRETGGADNRA
ncbi:MAG TPA: F0F1 ATP synthase subunit B, partial [Spirochaetia bacterium]|nr:F0F1 ATP synthase subunit B [Spirochaetia bacterium]